MGNGATRVEDKEMVMSNNRWNNCRWCGADWTHLQLAPRMDDDPELLAVLCPICGASGPDGKGRKEAVRKWNKGPLHRARMSKDLTCPRCSGDKLSYDMKELSITGSKLTLPVQCYGDCNGKYFTFMVFKRKGKVCLRGKYG